MTGKDRGQAFTLEGVIGTIVVLIAVILALQAVNVAPFADDARDEQVETLRTQVDDTLAAAADGGALSKAVTCVDASGDPDINVGNPGQPPTKFGALLNQALTQADHQFIATVEYQEDDGGTRTFERERLYPSGDSTPPDGAVSSTRQVVLHKSDPIYRTQGTNCREDVDGQTIGNTSNMYVDQHPDASDGSTIYTVVRIRVIAW